jgi:ABC-type proline/glycine betaine transport system permease subunit
MTTPVLHQETTLAKALGFAGLIPFIGLTYLINSFGAHKDFLRHALLAYGACIVSFVGAVHWGIWVKSPADRSGSNLTLVWSVVPSIVAWVALTIDTRGSMAAMAADVAHEPMNP